MGPWAAAGRWAWVNGERWMDFSKVLGNVGVVGCRCWHPAACGIRFASKNSVCRLRWETSAWIQDNVRRWAEWSCDCELAARWKRRSMQNLSSTSLLRLLGWQCKLTGLVREASDAQCRHKLQGFTLQGAGRLWKEKGVLYTLGVELAEGREGSYYCKLWTGRDDHLPRRAGRQAVLLVVHEIMTGS